MLIEDRLVRANKEEDVTSAENIYRAIMVRLRKGEADTVSELETFFFTGAAALSFRHVATAIAAFIRNEFRLRETRFHQFIFGGENNLSAEVSE